MATSIPRVKQPILTQPQFCAATGLSAVMTNNLVAREMIESDKIAGRHIKGGTRFWSFSTVPAGRIIHDLTTDHKIPLAEAAEIGNAAIKLASQGGYLDHWTRALEARRPFVTAFLVVARVDGCYHLQLVNGDDEGLPAFSSIPNKQRFLKRPFLVVPLSDIFEDVWKKCAAMLSSEERLK